MNDTLKYLYRKVTHQPHLVACLGVDIDFSARHGITNPLGKYNRKRPYGDLYDIHLTDKNELAIDGSHFEWSRN